MRDEPKERPILFSGEMVRAILAGHKTQTRRVLKPQPELRGCSWFWHDYTWLRNKRHPINAFTGGSLQPCPYGFPGDRLWVRETWCRTEAGVHYRADCRGWLDAEAAVGGRWKASIHMPRAISRLTLEIVKVRVERVADISEADALAEGVEPLMRGSTRYDGEARDTYRWLWGKLHGPESWAADPWVWVVDFRRIGA